MSALQLPTTNWGMCDFLDSYYSMWSLRIDHEYWWKLLYFRIDYQHKGTSCQKIGRKLMLIRAAMKTLKRCWDAKKDLPTKFSNGFPCDFPWKQKLDIEKAGKKRCWFFWALVLEIILENTMWTGKKTNNSSIEQINPKFLPKVQMTRLKL